MASLLDKIWASLGSTGTAPTDEKIELGFVRNDKPTWHRLNWLFNRVDENIDRLSDDANVSILKNADYMEGLTGATRTSKAGIEYFPSNNAFYQRAGSNVLMLSSQGAWGVVSSIAASGTGSAHTHSHVIFPGVADTIQASTSTSFSVDTIATGFGTVSAITTKYVSGGSDDFTAVTAYGTTGKVYYSTTGFGGTWVSATTPPAETSRNAEAITWIGGDEFICVCGQWIYKSTDNCDTWARLYDIGSVVTAWFDVNHDTNVIMCKRSTGGSDRKVLMRSTDGAETWTTVNSTDLGNAYDGSVKHVIGNTWIATGNYDLGYGNGEISAIISGDDGLTWERTEHDMNSDTSATLETYTYIATDGKKWMTQQALTEYTVKSLSL